MRAIRILSIAALLTALMTAPVIAGTPQEDRDAARVIIRKALQFEREAEVNIRLALDDAKENLASAATELEKIAALRSLPDDVRDLATEARATDLDVSRRIDEYRNDGEVTQEEQERLSWILSVAIQEKIEAIKIIDEVEFEETGKKPTPKTNVGFLGCNTQDQQVRAMSTCYTVDTWRIFIPRGARAAICKFQDGDGRRLTNLRPLFEDVLQETTCRLTDKTVVRNGVEKRVVRATLKLSALSSSGARGGNASVRVVALYR